MIISNVGIFSQVDEGSLTGVITPLDSALEFDTTQAVYNSPLLIDSTHSINFWGGADSDGFCQIFEHNNNTGVVTPLDSPLEFDTINGFYNASALIDSSHAINFWAGNSNNGFCRIFNLNTGTGVITPLGSTLEFDAVNGTENACALIDSSHVVNFWRGSGSDGFCQIFNINTGTGLITPMSTPLEFDTIFTANTSCALIDSSHVVLFWSTSGGAGRAQIFNLNTGTGVITALGTPFGFDTNGGSNSCVLLDSSHVLNFWQNGSLDGSAQVFDLNTGTGVITALNTPVTYDRGDYNSASLVDSNHVINFWADSALDGRCQVFNINTGTWVVTAMGTSYEFDTINGQHNGSLYIENNVASNFWAGDQDDGFTQLFKLT